MDGEHLRAVRTHLGMNQEQLAAALDVTQNLISRWETGKVTIRHDRILGLALERLGDLAATRPAATAPDTSADQP